MDTVWWIWRRALRKRIWCQDQDQEALDWEMLWSKDLDQESVVSFTGFTDREVPAGAAQLRLSGHLGGLAGRWREALDTRTVRPQTPAGEQEGILMWHVNTFAKLAFLKPIVYSVKKWGRVRKRKTDCYGPNNRLSCFVKGMWRHSGGQCQTLFGWGVGKYDDDGATFSCPLVYIVQWGSFWTTRWEANMDLIKYPSFSHSILSICPSAKVQLIHQCGSPVN